MAKKSKQSAAAKAKTLERARAANQARQGQTVSTQNIVAPYASWTQRNFTGVLEYVVTWTAEHYKCSRTEALRRLKLGADEGGVPMSVLRLVFVDYAIVDGRGIHSKMIKEKGEEAARKVLADINRYKDLTIKEVDRQSGMTNQQLLESVGLHDGIDNSYSMTRKSVITAWKTYYGGIRRLRQLDISIDDLGRAKQGDPYPPQQKAAMIQLFSALERRGLLQTTVRIKHILTDEELDILASAVWLVDMSPIDRI